MAAQIKEGRLNGGYGLWRVQGGANSDVTHIAFAGAKDLSALLSNTTPSKAFLAFQKKRCRYPKGSQTKHQYGFSRSLNGFEMHVVSRRPWSHSANCIATNVDLQFDSVTAANINQTNVGGAGNVAVFQICAPPERG